jgi:hypothetical protein
MHGRRSTSAARAPARPQASGPPSTQRQGLTSVTAAATGAPCPSLLVLVLCVLVAGAPEVHRVDEAYEDGADQHGDACAVQRHTRSPQDPRKAQRAWPDAMGCLAPWKLDSHKWQVRDPRARVPPHLGPAARWLCRQACAPRAAWRKAARPCAARCAAAGRQGGRARGGRQAGEEGPTQPAWTWPRRRGCQDIGHAGPELPKVLQGPNPYRLGAAGLKGRYWGLHARLPTPACGLSQPLTAEQTRGLRHWGVASASPGQRILPASLSPCRDKT